MNRPQIRKPSQTDALRWLKPLTRIALPPVFVRCAFGLGHDLVAVEVLAHPGVPLIYPIAIHGSPIAAGLIARSLSNSRLLSRGRDSTPLGAFPVLFQSGGHVEQGNGQSVALQALTYWNLVHQNWALVKFAYGGITAMLKRISMHAH